MLKKLLKWVGIGLGGLLGLVVLAAGVILIIGNARSNKKYEVPVETIAVATDPATVQRGQHLATIFLCTRCHLENLSGELYFDVPGMLSIPTPNLTAGAGGVGGSFTDEDWVRAIRHGVGQDGRPLFLMTSEAFQYLSADDLAAIIAYVKSVPPVDNQLPERRIDPVGKLMMGAGLIPPFAADVIDHTAPLPGAPKAGDAAAYGRYLTHTCTACHGANLSGAPFGPPGSQTQTPNLTPGGELVGWTEADFFATLRTGLTPGGHTLTDDMPWKYFGQMTDDELRAVWLYLQSLPARAQGE
jgi:mono/diheme cytochrome c family protein